MTILGEQNLGTGENGQAFTERDLAMRKLQGRVDVNDGKPPEHLADMVEVDGAGIVTGINKVSSVERELMQDWLQREVMTEGVQKVLESYSAEEQVSTLKYGNPKEGIETSHLGNYFTGNGVSNEADINVKIQNFIRALATKIGNTESPESEMALNGFLTTLETHGNREGVRKIAREADRLWERGGADGNDDDEGRADFNTMFSAKDLISWAKNNQSRWRALATAVLSSKDLGLRSSAPSNI